MSFGLNENGFNIKRFNDLKEEIENNIKAFYPDANTSPESVFGQLIGVFTKPQADLWEQLQKIYDSQNPGGNKGKSLDDICQYNGLLRISAKNTTVDIGLNGDPFVTIPKDTLVNVSLTNELFTLINDTIITSLNQNKIYIKITTYVESIDYIVTLNSIVNTVASGTGGTINSITQLIVDEINGNSLNPATATNLGEGVISLVTKNTIFNTLLNSNMNYYTIGKFQAINKGKILAIANTIVTITTPVTGLNDVENFEDGVTGRDIETDSEFRLRREINLQNIGGGTLPAIVSRLQNDIEGVLIVKGFENRTDVVDFYGRPQHSIEIVISGGVNQDIVDKLWEVKGGGIQTYGNTSGTVIDSNNDSQVLYFSRPTNIYQWVDAELTLYSEEDFPLDGVQQVSDIILDYGESIGIGIDVIPQRIMSEVYKVPGIQNVIITIGQRLLPGSSKPPMSTDIFETSPNEIAFFDDGKIDVTIP